MIKSSFKKVEKNTAPQRCAFGHPELDAVLSNSLAKGHLMVLEEDHPSTNYLSLLRYFISHHYSNQLTSIIYDTGSKWRHLVSPALKREKTAQVEAKSEIAWRYDNMNIKLSNLSLDERIAFTDLSKEVANPDEHLLRVRQYPNASPCEIYRSIEESYVDSQADDKDASTKKILLTSLPAYLYKHADFSQFLQALRCLTRSSNVLTLVTVPPIITPPTRSRLIKYADYYLQMGSLGKGYEDFTGSLTVLKEVECGALRSCLRGATVWGLKCGRKELRIENLYEQPLEEE
jgi:hypothetical protein